jgi:2',3'-cyclic-nucleotide 2'-phosphodiesterase / 3'-nucleotidase
VSILKALSSFSDLSGDPGSTPGKPAALAATRPAVEIPLRLIATSDLHACLMPYDYCANRATVGQGLDQIARQIAVARAEVPNSILLDNGDFLQGNPLADYVADSPRRRRPHPVITALNTLGYDAATLGNHEFNYGLPFLSNALAAARFPVVSANIATRLGKSPARDTTFVPPFTILTRRVIDSAGRAHRLRIGIIGFAPPQIAVWDRDHLQGRIHMRDIISAARAWLPRLRAQGADIIVALAHSGIGPIEAEGGMENAATALAALPEIDAVIAGHSHLTFPGPGVRPGPGVDPLLGRLAGKPAVMPGHSGSHIGIIDLILGHGPDSGTRWTVRSHSARLGTPTAAPMLATRLIRRAIAPDHRAALVWSRKVIGEARVPLHTHFATIAPSAAISVIAAAKAAHARAALDGTEWQSLPLLASAAPFRSGGRGGPSNFTDIAAGPLRMRSLSDLYVFPNTLVTLALTGADLSDWLEKSAALFHRITPGSSDTPLHDVAIPSFTFEVIPGLDYGIDLSQPARFDAHGRLLDPAAHRIVGLSHQGRPVDPDARYLLVTNNHRASRAAHEAIHHPVEVVLAKGSRTQTVLRDHFRSQGQVGCAPLRNWHFLAMPGTTVTVTTAPGADRHLADIASYRPEPIGPACDGFARFRLHL